jgi:hypothetical protein
MGALDEWNDAVQQLLDAGLSSLDAVESANKERPGLWRQAKAEYALQRGLIKSVGQPLDYLTNLTVREELQTMVRGGERHAAAGPRETYPVKHHAQGETMNASQQLLKMANDLVKSGEANDLTKAVNLVGPSNQQLWGERHTELRKAMDVNQHPPYGAPPEQRLPPARTGGHFAFDKLCAEEKARNPAWSQRQVEDAVLSTQQGQAAWTQNRAEVLSGRRGQ